MLDKKWYKSKTIWGFGLASLVALGQVFGIGISETAVAEIVKILSMFFGAYGVRSAVGK